MQEFAPINKQQPPSGHFPSDEEQPPRGHFPSDEELAAYIDGVLEKEEADRITAHLATCEDCYAIYSGAVRFQLEVDLEEEDKDEDKEKVVVFRPRKELATVPRRAFTREIRSRQWLSIAAVLVMGVGVGAYYQIFAPLALMPAEVAKQVSNRPGIVKDLWIGPVFRGEGGDEEMNLNDAAFRMGVQLVNLQVSLQAGERRAAQDAIAAILGLLDTGLITEDLKKKYSGITGALEDTQKAPSSFLPQASQLAIDTREVFLAEEDPSLDLGQWVEAGRLAAISKNSAFFNERENRSFLRRLLWQEKLGLLDDMKLDPETRESLQQIADISAKGNLGASDYVELKRRFEQILEIHYPVS